MDTSITQAAAATAAASTTTPTAAVQSHSFPMSPTTETVTEHLDTQPEDVPRLLQGSCFRSHTFRLIHNFVQDPGLRSSTSTRPTTQLLGGGRSQTPLRAMTSGPAHTLSIQNTRYSSDARLGQEIPSFDGYLLQINLQTTMKHASNVSEGQTCGSSRGRHSRDWKATPNSLLWLYGQRMFS